MEKILSIIVPSYNMEAYLPKCLGSLIIDDKELLQKLDVIVVNDGSKDRTSEIAHEFEARYPGIFRVVDKSNGNYGSCINAALAIASGEFIKVLDADDRFDAQSFAQMLGILFDSECNSEQLDLLLTDFVEVNENDENVCYHTLPLPENNVCSVSDVKSFSSLYMHSIVYRTKNLRDIGYLQTEGISYTDNEWTFYPMITIRNFKYLKLPVYRYLVGRQGQTIDPSVLKKSVWNHAIIAKRMTKELGVLRKNVGDVVYRYLEEVAIGMNVRVYNNVMLVLHNKESDQHLIEFDGMLAATSETIHKKVMSRLFSRTIRFYYGVHWRKKQSSNTLALCFFRMYRKLIVFKKWFCFDKYR